MNAISFHRILFSKPLLIFLVGWLSACFQTSADDTVSDNQAGIDSSATIRYAKGFQIEDKDGVQLLSIQNPFNSKSKATEYALVKREDPAPEGFSNDRIIRIPIRSIAVTSNLHVGAISRLDAADFLVAVGDADQIYSESVKKRFLEGDITEIQKGASLNVEKIIALQPDVLMVTGSPEEGLDKYSGIIDSGIPVILNSEWMENTPLGRAEWVKLVAALTDRLNFAAHQFAMVESTYLDFAEKVKASGSPKPGVLLGNEFQGTWHMPGGNSFMGRLLEDAGANYHWQSIDQTGGIPLNYESVYPIALEADVWLNIYLPTPDAGKKELLAMDSRYADFKSVKNGQLYSFNNRVASNGANDYWESSALRPDLLLMDFIHILHPNLLPQYKPYFCKKLD